MESEGKKDKTGKVDRDARNRELVMRCREGDGEARNLLFKENDGLLKMAVNRLKGFRYMEEDLLQEARQEMIRIVEDFDLRQSGVKFSTYAFNRIFWKMCKIADKESSGQLRKKTKIRREEDGEERAWKVIAMEEAKTGQGEKAEKTVVEVVTLKEEDIDSIPAAKGGIPENVVLRREYDAELEEYLNGGFLTAGEQAVIRGIVQGKKSKEIGARLYRREWEIEKIKKRALEKVMYAEERETLFPEYAAGYLSELSSKSEGDTKYNIVLEDFLKNSGFLTASEQAVMGGIASGEGYDEIGAKLYREAWEIEKIEKRALEKMMYVRDREELFPRGFVG